MSASLPQAQSALMASHRMVEDLLHALGVTSFFGVSGANIEPLFSAIEHTSAQLILAKHEFSAGAMAEGSARVSGKPAAVLTTSGAGAYNLVPLLAEAFSSRTPLVACVGDIPLAQVGQGAFQEASGQIGTLSLKSCLDSVSRFCVQIRSQEDWDRAIQCARKHLTSGTPDSGPVVFILPRDVQLQSWEKMRSVLPQDDARAEKATWHAAETQLILQRFMDSSKRAILVGEEWIKHFENHESQALFEKLNTPVILTLQAKAVLSSQHPLFAGLCGSVGHSEVLSLIRDSEAVLVLGSRLPLFDRYGIDSLLNDSSRTVISFSSEGSFIQNLPYDHRLKDRVSWQKLFHLLNDLDSGGAELSCATSDSTEVPGLRTELPQTYLEQITRCLSAATQNSPLNWVFDAGNACASVAKNLVLHPDSTFTIALGMGGMGYSFGAAIGIAANMESQKREFPKKKPTIQVVGDGSFFMHGPEIHTARENGIPHLVIVLNNSSHAMCGTREELYLGGRGTKQDFKPSFIADGMKALFPEIHAHRVESLSSLQTEMSEFLENPKLTLIELVIDASEFPSFMPFLDRLKFLNKRGH